MYRSILTRQSRRLFSSDGKAGVGKTLVGDRGAEAKGAMQEFIQKQTQATGKNSLWDRLKKDIAPPIVAPSSASRGRDNQSNGSSTGPRRVMNQRNNFARRSVGGPSGPTGPGGSRASGGMDRSGNSGGDFDDDSDGYSGRRRRRGDDSFFENDDDDDEDDEEHIQQYVVDGEEEEEIDDETFWQRMEEQNRNQPPINLDDEDPEFRDLVSEMEHLAKLAKSGKYLDVDEMDTVDKFFANAFFESMKTKNFTYMEATDVSSKSARRIKLPKPRTLNQLLFAMQLNIQSAAEGTTGHALGTEAWNVVSKNYFMSQSEKHRIIDHIVTLQNQVTAYTQQKHVFIRNKHEDEDERPPTPGYDHIFHYKFRRGFEGIIEEKRLRRLNEDIYAKDRVVSQAPTDWAVQAVVDEDQL